MTARRWLLALVSAASLVLPLSAPMRAATTHEVEIVDFAFSPATLTIAVGDVVTWTNADAVAHTATGAGFDSGLLDHGESYSVTFTAAGTYDYLCTPHPTMTGRIIVQAAAAAPTAAPGGVPDVAMDGPLASPPWAVFVAMLLVAATVLASARRVVGRVTRRPGQETDKRRY
jgi:amicyanin